MQTCHPEKFLYSKKTRTRRGTLNMVGFGMYGQVFMGCTNARCRREIAVKKSLDDMALEYRAMKKAFSVVPDHVPEPYMVSKCRARRVGAPSASIMYYEYIPSKTLDKFNKITRGILYQILLTLYKFQKHGIRHNDVHTDNILIENGTHTPFITDFGHAYDVNLKYAMNGQRTDKRYDYHFFLNSVYMDRLNNPSILAFIERVIPRRYLGESTSKVFKRRLRYGVSYNDLPSLRSILTDPFFIGAKKNVDTY